MSLHFDFQSQSANETAIASAIASFLRILSVSRGCGIAAAGGADRDGAPPASEFSDGKMRISNETHSRSDRPCR